MTEIPERQYALTKFETGDYIFLSNDAQTMWRVTRCEGEGWSLYRWTDHLWIGAVPREDLVDGNRWLCEAQRFDSRAQAIRYAMKLESRR